MLALNAADESTSWVEHAACRGGPTSWWYASETSIRGQAALAICARCPVRIPCLAEAHALEVHAEQIVGIRGGLSASHRRASITPS